MNYEAWRITFQSSEQAAQNAFVSMICYEKALMEIESAPCSDARSVLIARQALGLIKLK